MRLGAGRPSHKPEIISVEELTREEILTTPAQVIQNSVKKFRDSHHRIARLCAMGLRTHEVAEEAGYSLVRVSTLKADPAFQELVAVYRKDVDKGFAEHADEYYRTVAANRIIAARMLNDKLSEGDHEDFTVSQLVSVHADAADRTGYPKRTMAVNVNLDFAAKLDQAIKRSSSVQSPRLLADHGGGPAAPVIDADLPTELTGMAKSSGLQRRRA